MDIGIGIGAPYGISCFYQHPGVLTFGLFRIFGIYIDDGNPHPTNTYVSTSPSPPPTPLRPYRWDALRHRLLVRMSEMLRKLWDMQTGNAMTSSLLFPKSPVDLMGRRNGGWGLKLREKKMNRILFQKKKKQTAMFRPPGKYAIDNAFFDSLDSIPSNR